MVLFVALFAAWGYFNSMRTERAENQRAAQIKWQDEARHQWLKNQRNMQKIFDRLRIKDAAQ